MTTITARPAAPVRERVDALAWDGLRAQLDSRGFAVTAPLLDAGECAELSDLFDGGEFVLLEQRPRAQSRAHVLQPPRGAFVVFPTQHRPQAGARGHYRVGLRHGVSTVTRGSRTALGVIFHDAR